MNSLRELILVLDDEPDMLRALERMLFHMGYRCVTETDPERALAQVRQLRPDLLLTDLRLPLRSGIDVLHRARGLHPDIVVIPITAYATIETAVQAIQGGASDYLPKPFSPEALREKIETHLQAKRPRDRAEALVLESRTAGDHGPAIGDSFAFRAVLERVKRIAGADASVLIRGESGTGKEVIARHIHALSSRRKAGFIPIDCCALSETLLESELFGHEKGAFTGAEAPRPGLFEFADGGTVFLDEVGEIPPRLQSRLLRVLQERSFRRAGGCEERRVDVRVLAATNADLEQEVQSGNFRKDLYYRLNCITLVVPPPRERPEDIALLAQHFLMKHGGKMSGEAPMLTPEAISALESYSWPGNVRELENAIVRAVTFRPTGPIRPEDLPAPVLSSSGSEGAPASTGALDDVRRKSERVHILRILEETAGHRGRAAALPGISRKTLWEKMRSLGIP
jgi:DNA-binding NtrC family response regulator